MFIKPTFLRFSIIFLSFILSTTVVFAQSIEPRVRALEDYVESFQPTLVELTTSIQESMKATATQVFEVMQQTEDRILIQVENQLQDINQKTIVLDVTSQAYQSLQTNTGLVLVSVEGLVEIDGKLQLKLNIGNPNYADFQGFKVRLISGGKHFPALNDYESWRQSLNGTEYTFEGILQKGRWNQVVIDLNSTDTADLGYIELELEIVSVQLQF